MFILLFTIISCSKKDELEKLFLTSEPEYWEYENNCGTHGIFFKFNKLGSYDKYNQSIDDGFELFNDDGDLRSGPRTWSIKDDSTFVWDRMNYKIKSINRERIILYYLNQENKDCRIRLTKVIDNKK